MLRRIWKSISTFFSHYTLLTFSILLVVFTLGWIVFVMILWPAENRGFIRENFILKGCDFEIVKPQIVPGDQPVSFQIRLTERCPSTPLIVSLQVPPELEIVDPQPQEYNRLELSLERGRIYSVKLRNTHLAPLIKSEKRISLKADEQKEIPLQIEGNLRTILLHYGVQEFPFIPFISLFLSIITLYRDSVLKQREIQERERKEKRKDAKNLMKQMREALASAQIWQAQSILHALEERRLIPELEIPDEVKIARHLLELAHGELRISSQGFPPPGWEEEAAGVLGYVTEYHPGHPELRFLLRTFPVARLQQKERFEQIRKKFLEIPLEQRYWPILPRSYRIPKKGELFIPFFRQGIAEREEPFLFSETGLFYTDHPIYRQLQQETGLCFVTGDSGSGRTALGLAFGRYYPLEVEGSVTFGCYLSWAATLQELQHALIARFLEFIESNPSQLTLWNQEQYRLSATLLCAALGKQVVITRLSALLFRKLDSRQGLSGQDFANYAEMSFSQEKRMSNKTVTTEEDNPKEAEKVRRAVEIAQIRMLLDVCRSTEEQPLPDSKWPAMLATCLRCTDFKHFYLVFDLQPPYSIPWHETVLLSFWHAFSLHWPDPSRPHVIVIIQDEKLESALLENTFSLEWSPEELKNLLFHRWKKSNSRSFLSLFEKEELLEALLTKANGNPRRLLKLVWNLFHRYSPPFSEAHVL